MIGKVRSLLRSFINHNIEALYVCILSIRKKSSDTIVKHPYDNTTDVYLYNFIQIYRIIFYRILSNLSPIGNTNLFTNLSICCYNADQVVMIVDQYILICLLTRINIGPYNCTLPFVGNLCFFHFFY